MAHNARSPRALRVRRGVVKMSILMRLQVVFAVIAVLSGYPGAASARNSHRHYATTASDILDVEAELVPVKAREYAFVDDVIDAAKQKVAGMAQDRPGALQAFQAIDQILVTRNVIYPGSGLIQYFHDGLTPRQLSNADFDAARLSSHNQRRLAVMAANRGKPFYVLDCDTASFLYLAIADALKLPVQLVEVPGHNFVRWSFPDGTHLNFETMDGIERPDDYYLTGYQVLQSTIKPGFFMSAMTHDDVMGYVRMLRGGGWGARADFVRAKRDYDAARNLRPGSPAPLNGESWVFGTCTPDTCRDGARAVGYAQQAVALWRTGNYLDTLACAQASAGDYAGALVSEQAALVLDSSAEMRADLAAIQARQICANQFPPVAAQGPSALRQPGFFVLPPARPAKTVLPRRLMGND